MRIEVRELPDAWPASGPEEAAIRALLSAHNAAAGWQDGPRKLQAALLDPTDAVRGGALALLNWRWVWVMTLAVAPECRGQGLGGRLLGAIEQAGAERGAFGVRLDTYSFQALGFYERLGYRITGRIEDCPPGHTRFTLAKRLESTGSAG